MQHDGIYAVQPFRVQLQQTVKETFMKPVFSLTPAFAGKLLASAILVGLGSSVCAQEDAAAQAPLPLDEVRIFTQVLEQIRSAYVEELDDKTLLENAIRGMLSGIDPHSTYLVNEAYDNLQESTTGEYGGLGVEISVEDGTIVVISPMEDSPAERAGVKAGDLIIRIDETPTREVTVGDTVDLMRGPPGTEIILTIIREGEIEPLEIPVTREIISSRSVRYRTIEPGYGYIRIAQFMTTTGEQTRDALISLHEDNQPLKGVVLDLRNNPGGVLGGAVDVVDAFIESGLIVYTEGRLENSGMEFEATPNDPSQGVPLVVLINGGSASASEIVAGALQDHQRAIIMGTQSFGKGSVQTVLPLSENRAIKLTTALYYTPNGRSIQALGITPDITVDRGQVTRIADSSAAYREADLSGHLANGNGTPDGTVGQTQALEVLVSDYQLNEAINILKGLNIVRPNTIPALSRRLQVESPDLAEVTQDSP